MRAAHRQPGGGQPRHADRHARLAHDRPVPPRRDGPDQPAGDPPDGTRVRAQPEGVQVKKFNAAAARSKRPCPIWIDAFLRDTQHLAADEVGSYILILMAMWSRESCDFPDDDHRLARLCRMSLRLWKTRVGPVIRPFFRAVDGVLISKRLREEATYVERQCKAQSDRKTGENADKSLNDNDAPPSADATTDETADIPPDHPSQQPNNPTVREDDDESAGARQAAGSDRMNPPAPEPSFFDRVLAAAGMNPSDILAARWMPPAAEIEVNRWREIDPLLTEALIIDHVAQSAKRHTERARGPKAFEAGLRHLAAMLQAPAPAPLTLAGGGAARPNRPHQIISHEEMLAALRRPA
ncbi:hypothetical protein CNY89_04605 [Amaricoccus sp. HAR-UPW-R2A-40]|nr:hypothetical protein CNY89_04605 [Amaricoccus sp. HAR-UPW-R2A-40]